MPSPTAASVTAAGISAPPFATLLSYLESQWQAIYGSDVVLTPDTKDGQFLGILAAAVNDANSAAIAAYQSFSPASAQGAALSTNCRINGIQRMVPTNSTVTLTLTGIAGTVIPAGLVTDTGSGNRWDLPPNVVIGSGGTVTTTATCEAAGAITAAANTVTGMATLILGWQSVTNPAAATPGQPVETDGALRVRQAASTTLPSLGVMDGILGAILAVSGVTAVRAYQNETGSTDSNGIPAGAICFVVEGGSSAAIAQAIATKKTPGIQTYASGTGAVTVSVPVAWGPNVSINFFVATQVVIKVSITLHNLANYTSTIGAEIQAAVAAYINSLGIGQNVMIPRIYVPASLAGPFAAPASPLDPLTYELTQIQLAQGAGSFASSDITIGFSSIATCLASNVSITVS